MKIALIAHDGKKADMVHFLSGFREALHRSDIELVATGTTGSHIEKAGFQVEKLLSGPYGGDAQIAALAAEKKLTAVIFFRDPLDKHPHECGSVMCTTSPWQQTQHQLDCYLKH